MKQMVKRYKAKVVDKVSDVLSFPWRYSAKRSIAKSKRDTEILRRAKQIPDYAVGSDYRDENFRTKVMADNIKSDLNRNNK